MKIELTNTQLNFIEAVLLQYSKDRKEAASESKYDEDVSEFFLERAKKADSVYAAIVKQREN